MNIPNKCANDVQIQKTDSRSPFLSLGLPPSRKQVDMLDNWLNKILLDIEKSKGISKKEKCEQRITMHQFCILEIIRQVSVHCMERGSFLQKIINRYSELIIE